MHLRGQMLIEGENYHVFNRGAHKQAIFFSQQDYDRFQQLLFLANDTFALDMRALKRLYKGRSFADVFTHERQIDPFVDIFAYALMPNHFHLVLRQKVENGVSRFLKKLCTAYSMYVNTKYDHSGVVFQGRFKANHIDTEAYFRYIFAYVHLNPVELVEPDWKRSGIRSPKRVRSFLSEYSHSSYYDYSIGNRSEGKILSENDSPDFLRKQNDLEDLLKSEASYDPAKDRPLHILTKVGPL